MGRVKDTGKVDPKEVYQYLKQKGLSDEHALGILTNIEAESGFNYTAVGDKGTSIGLFQHHASRADNLKKFAGSNWKDWKKQVDFALQEKPTQSFLKSNFKTPAEASEWWTVKWEVPSNKYEKAAQRAKGIPAMAAKVGVGGEVSLDGNYENQVESTTQTSDPNNNTNGLNYRDEVLKPTIQIMSDTGEPIEVDIESLEKEVSKIGKVEERLDKSEDRQEVENKKQERVDLFKEFGVEAKGIVPYRTRKQEEQDLQERSTGYEIQNLEIQTSLPELPNIFSLGPPPQQAQE